MATMLDFSRPHLLRNGKEYRAALAEVEDLMDGDPTPGTADGDRLEFLALLIEQYEELEYPDGPAPRPQDVVAFVLEQRGMERADLHELMGGKARVSEFFAGKRDLSMAQVRALKDALGVPADLLITTAPSQRHHTTKGRKAARMKR